MNHMVLYILIAFYKLIIDNFCINILAFTFSDKD